jgi:lipopolysaccharide export system permease protein
MIEILTRNPLFRFLGRPIKAAGALLERARKVHDKGGVALRVIMAGFLLGLGLLFAGTILDYRDAAAKAQGGQGDGSLSGLPSVVPVLFQGLGMLLALVAFLVSLWVNERNTPERRRGLVVITLAIAAVAGLAAWLPTDVSETLAAIKGKAPAGETPSIGAYLGMLFLVSILILSVPVAALLYFRLDLMDRYVVHNFLSPFFFCLLSFMAIWILASLTDKGETLATLSFSQVLTFYVVQVPFMILFVMPIATLLSGLFSLSKMSKSNEFISMIGAGRSVPRILAPLFIAGAYVSLIGLAFKYEWAPASVGYTEAIIGTAKREQWVKEHGGSLRDEIWAQRGWMHMNDVDHRSWFVGRVPLKLDDEMADVIVSQIDTDGQPRRLWIARRAKWVWDAQPPKWILTNVRIYTYDTNHIPTIEGHERLEITDWSETPWKVLSSSQNPEYLGIPGLTMYLNANRDRDARSLASFRTNWWYIFAEPLACFAMILVAAPLGIVYSRRGVMGGVTGAICIFAMMYIMRGTFLAMGHSDRMSPFVAAWLTNVLVAAIGLVLLWYRAQNRELPKLKTLLQAPFRRAAGRGTSAKPAKPVPVVS